MQALGLPSVPPDVLAILWDLHTDATTSICTTFAMGRLPLICCLHDGSYNERLTLAFIVHPVLASPCPIGASHHMATSQ